MTDEELLQAWSRGDPKAARTLLDRYFRTLYGFFRTKINEGIEDLIQDTLMACVKGRESFCGERFRAYMYGAARKILYREYQRRRKQTAAIDPEVTSVRDLSPGVSTEYARQAEVRLLLDGLQTLPLNHQIAIELRYFDHLSCKEIAEALEIPDNTVRSRLARGLATLRDRVETMGGELELRRAAGKRLRRWEQSLNESFSVDKRDST